MEQTITLYPHKDYLQQSQRFFDAYDIFEGFLPGREELQKLKPRYERVCRFCGAGHGETTFGKKAHLISELLGNKGLLSDFECDQCNKYFDQKFENSLSNFLGMYRTLSGTKGKRGIPGFTSPGENIKAKGKFILGDDTIIISREDIQNGTIITNKEKGLTTIRYQRNPFSPLMVYKSILKIALSIIKEDEINNDYQYALDFLMGRGNVIFTGCLMSGYALPFTSEPLTPQAYLFKKKDPNAPIHTHVMALYFQHFIMALPVPLNKNDLKYFDGRTITLDSYPIFPPFYPMRDPSNLIISGFTKDFTSEEVIKGIEDEIFIQYDPAELANSHVYDSNSDQTYDAEYNPSEIKKIIIRLNGDPVDPRELAKLLNQMDIEDANKGKP